MKRVGNMGAGTSYKRAAIFFVGFLLCLGWIGIKEAVKINAAVNQAAAEAQVVKTDLTTDDQEMSATSNEMVLLASNDVSVNGQPGRFNTSLTDNSRIKNMSEPSLLSLGSAGKLLLNSGSDVTLSRQGQEVRLNINSGAALYTGSSLSDTRLSITTGDHTFTAVCPKGSSLAIGARDKDLITPVGVPENSLASVQLMLPSGLNETLDKGMIAQVNTHSVVKGLYDDSEDQDSAAGLTGQNYAYTQNLRIGPGTQKVFVLIFKLTRGLRPRFIPFQFPNPSLSVK